jgi:hypothetical protein
MDARPDTQDATPLIVGGFVLAAIAIVLANTNVPKGENGGTGAMIGTLIFIAVVAAMIYFLLLPRVGGNATVAVVLGVVAVLAIVVYWSGLPFVLGAAAVVVGRRAVEQGRLPLVARVLGAVGVVGGVAALFLDKAE